MQFKPVPYLMESWGWNTLCGSETKISEAWKDINACDGSLGQLESPCLVLVLWVHPLLAFVSFPTVHAIYKPWEYKQSLGKYVKSHPCNSGTQSRKLVQTHSVPQESNVRLYTQTQVMYSCCWRPKSSSCIFLGKMRVILVQKLSLCLELLFCDGRYISIEGMCPKMGAKIRMSRIETCILQSTDMSQGLQSGCPTWDCSWGTPVKSCCVIYSTLKNGEIPLVRANSSEAMEKVG